MADIVPAPEHIFPLEYYGGFATYTIDVYMLRCRHWSQPDDFTVHAVEDGRWLGYGETKDEAVSHAQMTLAPEAERRSFVAGLIDRPWGSRIAS